MDSATGTGRRHAVVVGGSLAGLLAAHVLAGHADRVTVVERDRFPEGGGARPGVPQGRHPHVLLKGGQTALESLLPGFLAELRAAGAPWVGLPSDMALWQNGHWLRRFPASTHIFTGSRGQLEELVRRRVLADPAIEVLEGTDVVGFLGDSARVRGVRVRDRAEGAGAGLRDLAADLVVDASGAGTKAPQWLTELGAGAVHEETIDTGLAYTSRIYRGEGGIQLDADTVGYYVYPSPEQVHGGGALPLEDGTHLVIVSGLRGDEPPTGDEEFVAYTKRLGHPLLDRWLAEAEPLTPPFGFRRTSNVRRRYDLPGTPAGFLATGDALCTFNPIYGQGMAIAAMSAVALRDALAGTGRRTPTTRRVQRVLLAASRQAWDISAGADRQMPGAVGTAAAIRPADRVSGWYLRRVTDRSPGDPVVGRAFRAVLTLAEPVTALFAPPVLRAVLFGAPAPTPAQPQSSRELDRA